MNLKSMWMLRNFLLDALYWLFSASAFVCVFAWIKTEKLYQFGPWMYQGNLNDPNHWLQVHTSYWKSDVWPVLYLLPIAIIFDLLTRRFYAKVS